MRTNSKVKKEEKSNLKKHKKIINLSVITGFLFLLIWIFFFYQKTFIDIKIVLALLFIPSLIVTILLYKKFVPISLENTLLNTLSFILVYFLITIPIGNFVVILFFSINTFLASDHIEKVNLKIENVDVTKIQKRTLNKNNYYSHFDVTYNGVLKKFKTGDTQIDELENKTVEFKLAKGFFGYYIIKGRKIQ
ncbi:hypothetical protein [Flavobacterium sp.]|uniref:hypothetical protein n=1 Tax=Flavobacterium sp. TaxID=239 RepID=UPI0026062268|nr:hypothetical protein [Flavobacterium sp.]